MADGHAIRLQARDIFRHALSEASIEKALSRHLSYERGVLRVCEDLYDIHSYARLLVVSFGKAGHRMAEDLSRRMGPPAMGIIADPNPPSYQLSGYRYFAGSHPHPNDESMLGANAILKTLRRLGAGSLALFLISGGGSSVVETPIDPEISLEDLITTYRALVHSGAPIAQINAIRKHLSAVKGGRMAQAAGEAQQVSMLVADVPENSLDALSSGPTMPDSTTVEDCYRIAKDYGMTENFPPSVRALFEHRALEETPKPDDAVFARSRWWKILSNETAEKAAAMAAVRLGLTVEIDHSCDDWEYHKAAGYLLNRLRRLRQEVSRACIISGGEVTVKVTANAGLGGRNQHFVLDCATKIAGENMVVLSAGTDGIDGNSIAAGGVADGTTLERAHAAGLDVADHLRRFNSFPLLETLGDSIHTGPTGTNVRDLRILLAY